MDIKKVTFIIASSLVLCFMASAQSKLISINEKGKLSYHSYTDKEIYSPISLSAVIRAVEWPFPI